MLLRCLHTKLLCTFIFIWVWTSSSVIRKYKTPKGAVIQESTIYNIYYFLKIRHFRGFHYCFKHLLLFFYLVNPQSYSKIRWDAELISLQIQLDHHGSDLFHSRGSHRSFFNSHGLHFVVQTAHWNNYCPHWTS